MIGLITQPIGLQAAYLQQVFSVAGQLNYPTNPPLYSPVLQAIVSINGIEQDAVLKFTSATLTDMGGGFWSYLFDADISEVLQEYFKNNATLPAMCSNQIHIDDPITYIVTFTEFYESGGVMVKNPTTSTTAPLRVFNASLPVFFEQDLGRFDPLLPPSDFLTNKPKHARVVCREDCESITILDWTGVFSYIAYDASGTQIGIGTYSDAGASGQITLPTGPANLSAFTWDAQSGAFPNDPNTASYTVGVAGASELLRYYVSKSCCTTYRIVFLNMYGAYDYFSISKFQDESFIVKSDDFERIWGSHSYDVRGLNRVQAYGQDVFKIEQVRVHKDTVVWLKELLNSSDVYLENMTIPPEHSEVGRLAVVVKDATFKTIRSESDYLEFECTLVASTRWFSQRN